MKQEISYFLIELMSKIVQFSDFFLIAGGVDRGFVEIRPESDLGPEHPLRKVKFKSFLLGQGVGRLLTLQSSQPFFRLSAYPLLWQYENARLSTSSVSESAQFFTFLCLSNHFRICITLAIILLGRKTMSCEASGMQTRAVSILRNLRAL